MKGIEKTSFLFLLSCFILLLGSTALFGIIQYTSYENLFIPPADFDNNSVRALNDSTNLEGLKKACLFWANQYDSNSKVLDEMLSQFNSLLQNTIKWIIFLSVFFGVGFASIYIKLRRVRIENQNAL